MLRTLLFAIATFSSAAAFSVDCSPNAPENFKEFFPRFASEKAFAVTRTEYPLKTVVWEYGVDKDGNDAPKANRSATSKKADRSSPALLTFMKKNGMESKVSKTTEKGVVVDVFKPDTDWLFSYHFSLRKGCWYLKEFQNHSL